jgi:hypothetical protein
MKKVTSSGDRLSILITCEYEFHHNWMSFSSWYSAYKSLPDAEVAMLCARDLQKGYIAYNWPYRCDIRFFQHENVGKRFGCPTLNKLYATFVALKEGMVSQPLLVIDDDVMAVRGLSKDLLGRINDPELTFGVSGDAWYFNNLPTERFVEALHTFAERYKEDGEKALLRSMSKVFGEPEVLLDLCCDCRKKELASFVSYKEAVGRMVCEDWRINKNHPPFYYTSELAKGVEITANENHIIKMWSQMRQVYDAVR